MGKKNRKRSPKSSKQNNPKHKLSIIAIIKKTVKKALSKNPVSGLLASKFGIVGTLIILLLTRIVIAVFNGFFDQGL